MRIYKCANGTEYIYFGTAGYSVDDVIAFLEPHRGKNIYTGALEHPCLQIDNEYVWLEELDYFTMDCAPEDNKQLVDDLYEFFFHEDGNIANEEDRLSDGKDEEGNE